MITFDIVAYIIPLPLICMADIPENHRARHYVNTVNDTVYTYLSRGKAEVRTFVNAR